MRSVVIVAAALALIGAWFLRPVTASMSDTAVRHGVATRALVLGGDGDAATIRVPTADGDVVARVDVAEPVTAGSTLPVVYDAADPSVVSVQGAPAPTSPLVRGLFVVGLCAVFVVGSSLATRRRPHRAPVDHGHHAEVRGGRAVDPARTDA